MQGGNIGNLFDIDIQSAANFCVDTIKYGYIPSVPSGLEGLKTRPKVSSDLIATNIFRVSNVPITVD